jgi:hypothetical protein
MMEKARPQVMHDHPMKRRARRSCTTTTSFVSEPIRRVSHVTRPVLIFQEEQALGRASKQKKVNIFGEQICLDRPPLEHINHGFLVAAH